MPDFEPLSSHTCLVLEQRETNVLKQASKGRERSPDSLQEPEDQSSWGGGTCVAPPDLGLLKRSTFMAQAKQGQGQPHTIGSGTKSPTTSAIQAYFFFLRFYF